MQLEALHPWLSLDVPLQFSGTRKTSALIDTMPQGVTKEMIEEAFAKTLPESGIYTQIIDSTAEQPCVFLLVNRSISEKSEELLRSLGFARPTNLCAGPPKEEAKRLEKKTQRIEEKISAAEDGISSHADNMKLDENEHSTQIRLMKVKDMMLEEAHHYKERLLEEIPQN